MRLSTDQTMIESAVEMQRPYNLMKSRVFRKYNTKYNYLFRRESRILYTQIALFRERLEFAGSVDNHCVTERLLLNC